MKNPDFSIVIPTRGDYSSIVRLLNSLRCLSNQSSFEVLVIVNPEKNLKVSALNSFSDLFLTQLTSAIGVNAARNVGLKNAKGRYILFLDDDCEVTDPQLLIRHMKYLIENSWAFAVGGYYHNPHQLEIYQAYNNIQNTWIQQNIFRPNGETTVLLGGHFSIRNSSPTPFFDEEIVYGGSETEFFFRLFKLGYRFLQTDLSIDHHPLLNTSILAQKAYLQGKTHALLLKNNLFINSQWKAIQQNSKNRYENLYHSIFNEQKLRINSSVKKEFPKFSLIKSFHEKICFYLENRTLF